MTAPCRSGRPVTRPAGTTPVELPAAPSLGRLYAAGITRSVRLGIARRTDVSSSELPTTEVVLRGVRADPEHLTAYQHLVGEPAGDELPAGFVHVLAFPVATALLVRDDFPLPLVGMVHVANRVEQRRAVRLDEAVDIQVSTRDLTTHRAGVTVDVVAHVRVGEELVWQGVSTYLAKGWRLREATGQHRAPGDRAEVAGAERVPFRPPVLTGQWRLGADLGRRYAEVSGDRNPIHLSAAAAKAFGFPRAIAHGMYSASRALADVGPSRGPAFSWDVELAKPVLLPSTVSVRVAARGAGHDYVGWDGRTGRKHFSGAVLPLRQDDWDEASAGGLSRRRSRPSRTAGQPGARIEKYAESPRDPSAATR
ncbi:MAG: Dehydratase [Actinotalea sp.]|nr:Dehydratase [Actinotalea sp.]